VVAGDKNPAIASWKPYMQAIPLDSELVGWFEEGRYSIGVVCGAVSGNLVVMDFDDANTYSYCISDWQSMNQATWVVETGRGIHVYFRSEAPVESHKYERLHVDVKGEGGYVVAPPSNHPSGGNYAFQSQATEIGTTDWADIQEKLDQREEEWPFVQAIMSRWKEGNRQNLTLGIAAFFRKHLHFSAERTERVLMGIARVTNDEEEIHRMNAVKCTYDKALDEISIGAWLDEPLIKELYDILEQSGLGNDQDDAEDEQNVCTPGLILEDGTIVDEIVVDGKPIFIVYKNGGIELRDTFEINGISYRPVDDILRQKGAVLLPSGIDVYGTIEELYLSILAFIDKWVECDPDDAKLMAMLVMVGWIHEKIPVLPIINPRGASDTGKTRLGTTLWAISFRGMRVDGVLTLPSLFRTAEKWKGTICINEADFHSDTGNRQESESSQLTKFYNGRYEKDALVWRTRMKTYEPEAFRIFGPTILITRKGFDDDGLESRCFRIHMQGRTRTDIPLNLTPEFYREAAILRNKLELFRLNNLNSFENDDSIEFWGVSSRLNQMLQPIATFAKMHLPGMYEVIRAKAVKLAEDEVDERSNAVDGLIVQAYFMLDAKSGGVTASQIADKIREVFGEWYNPNIVGRRAKALGFRSHRTSGGLKRLLTLSEKLAPRLSRKYVPQATESVNATPEEYP